MNIKGGDIFEGYKEVHLSEKQHLTFRMLLKQKVVQRRNMYNIKTKLIMYALQATQVKEQISAMIVVECGASIQTPQ